MSEERKDTDDVSGVAVPPESSEDLDAPAEELGAEPTATADPPPAVAELAAACVRFVATRYGIHLDFDPDTLSLVDQWGEATRGSS